MRTHKKPWGPGKTAPRLVDDLNHYDPERKRGYNLLTDAAPRFKGDSTPQRRIVGDCKHFLVVKDQQTDAPTSIANAPDETTKYVVATYCQKCRWHFHITVDFWAVREGQVPCSLADEANLLHHLRYLEPTGPLKESEDANYYFACSGSKCPVNVKIQIFPPRLGNELLRKFDNTTVLNHRGRNVIAEEPERYTGLPPLTPVHVFANLKQYLEDAKWFTGTGERKKIAKRNKKYYLAFANECDDLFHYLGFTEAREEKEDGAVDYFWQLPIINDKNKDFIDDVKYELKQLIASKPEVERSRANYHVVFAPLPALKQIESSLGYHGYRQKSRMVDLTQSIEHPSFASLGALENFTDDFLAWAYDRQRECDPQNIPYYLDCLYTIARGRHSSDLETKFSMATSTGELRLTEIEAAYRYFVLDADVQTTDDHIIGLFNSRVQSAPRQADQARENLRIIGKARMSKKIELVAMDKSMTYEEALELLPGVDATTPFDSVLAVAVLVSSEAADEQKKKVPYALLLIGKEKGKENDLNGQTELLKAAFDMAFGNSLFRTDVDSAYRTLEITNRNAPDQLVWQYHVHGGSVNINAVYTIAMDRKSKFLLAHIDPSLVPGGTRTLASEPVGLDNIGNTCYLNSILQFYYTIRSIRDVVSNIDDYRMDLDSPTIHRDIDNKKVGGRKIARSEIENAQKFVYGLKNLFEQLKTSPTSSVRPTTELANLTLLSDEKVAQYRRDSVTSPDGPPNLELNENTHTYNLENSPRNTIVYGPQPRQLISPTPTPPPEDDIEMVDRPTDKDSGFGDDSSETTLIDTEIPDEEPNASANPFEEEKNIIVQEDAVQTLNVEDDIIMINGEHVVASEKAPPEPEKPPPVPPRNKPDQDLWAFGAQQDVTEVVGNVVFRLQCAIKAESIESGSGEQIDRIRDTFYGANATYTQKSQTLEKKVEPWANLIIYPDRFGPRDIYAALDVTFDMQMVDVEKKKTRQYSSIVKLPPILQMHIQRTAYDNVKNRPWKNMNSVTFPETLYMDRYMDSDDNVLLRRREEAWTWKARLRDLEKRQATLRTEKLSVDEALIATKHFVSELQELEAEGVDGLDIAPDLPDALEERIPQVQSELTSLDVEITTIKQRLREQFTDMTKHEYRLQTVFIHRGESGSGHYWIYIYDFEHRVWREYNDDRISEIHDLKQIFEKHGVIDGTPYYLAYVRSADRKELVNAVVREIVEPSVEEIITIDDDDDLVGRSNHIENIKPRDILPKPDGSSMPPPIGFERNRNQISTSWDTGGYSELDANGRPWS